MASEEEILLNITAAETRAAWVKNSILQEVRIERENNKSLVGKVYYGKVERVMQGIQATFVDIGLDKAGFLSQEEISSKFMQQDKTGVQVTKLLRPGQKILVQVVKDSIGSKGAKLTMRVRISSSFLVLMPAKKMVMISQRIDYNHERNRLKNLVKEILKNQGSEHGFIIRTSAENIDGHKLTEDIKYLDKLWAHIQENIKQLENIGLVYAGLPLYLQMLRNIAVDKVSLIQVDSAKAFDEMQEFSTVFAINIMDKLTHYVNKKPIFDLYNIDEAITQALEKRVDLNSGGYLVIDQTEAMSTIDVNTGSFVGSKSLEETIYTTNLEATKAVARQLRLRNLGGIIILDLIDMTIAKHKKSVLESLQKELAKDGVKTTIGKISNLGLIEITRKKTRESLEGILCTSCLVCNARGVVKTVQSVTLDIFREITRMANQFKAKKYRIIASQLVVAYILDEVSEQLVELEKFLKKEISLQAEIGYLPEQFDVIVS